LPTATTKPPTLSPRIERLLLVPLFALPVLWLAGYFFPPLNHDVAAILDFCKREPVREGPAGAIGFCMGGREAFFAGQECPDRFRATASLHGSRLVTEAKDSPHLLTGRMRKTKSNNEFLISMNLS